MGEQSYEYKCSNGHTFRSKATIRAFCPKCGESVRRIKHGSDTEADGSNLQQSSSNDDNKGNVRGENNGDAKTKGSEEKQPEKSQEEKETEPERKEPARTKVIRVKRKQKDKDDEPVKDKKSANTGSERVSGSDNSTRNRLIKRRRIRQRYSHPKVKGKVKTNKESADDKQNKTQNLTTWEKIRGRAGFGS